MIYDAELSSPQMAGEKGYPSYQKQIHPATDVSCLLSNHTDVQIKSTLCTGTRMPAFVLRTEFHEFISVMWLPRLSLNKERIWQRSQSQNLLKKKKASISVFYYQCVGAIQMCLPTCITWKQGFGPAAYITSLHISSQQARVRLI